MFALYVYFTHLGSHKSSSGDKGSLAEKFIKLCTNPAIQETLCACPSGCIGLGQDWRGCVKVYRRIAGFPISLAAALTGCFLVFKTGSYFTLLTASTGAGRGMSHVAF